MKIKSSIFFAKRLIFPLSRKYSCARKSLLGAIICIGISIVPLVSVISVSDGLIGGMTDRIIGLSTGHLQAYLYKNSEYSKNLDNISLLSSKIESIDGVVKATPQIEIDALAAGKNYRTGIHIRAVPPNIFTTNESFVNYFKILNGSLENFVSGSKNSVIGQKTAELLNLKVGDSFRIITTTKNNDIISPKISMFKVAAIISSGYQELDSLWVFVPIDTAFSFLSINNATFTFIIQTLDAFSSDLFKIRKMINNKLKGDVITYTWKELNSSQLENFSSTKIMLIFIMMLIVLIAAVNISAALIMLVIERRREIAILKSIGGTSIGITNSFLITGFFCGFVGCLFGIPVGVICSININKIVLVIEKIVNLIGKTFFIIQGNDSSAFISTKIMDPTYYLTEIPTVIPIKSLSLVFISVIILSILVSIIPSIKAGKEKPIDTLRSM